MANLVPANTVVSRWFVRRRGLALGLTSFGLGVAGVILPPIFAGLLSSIGWRMIWRISGVVIALFIAPIVVLVMRDRPMEREGQHYLSDKDAARPSHNKTDASGLTVRDVFSRKNFWLLNLGYLSIIACTAGSLQNLAPIVTHDGLDQRTAGVLLSGFSVSHLFSTVIMGLLSDRFGNRLPLTGLALVTAAGTALIAFGHTTSVLGLGVMLIGFSGGIWPLMSAAIAIEFGTQAMGRAFGILGAFLPFAVVTPFIVARVQESTGSYTPALTGLAVLAILGAGCCLMMRERTES
jgi:sugar phosphate permease